MFSIIGAYTYVHIYMCIYIANICGLHRRSGGVPAHGDHQRRLQRVLREGAQEGRGQAHHMGAEHPAGLLLLDGDQCDMLLSVCGLGVHGCGGCGERCGSHRPIPGVEHIDGPNSVIAGMWRYISSGDTQVC